MRPKTLTVVIGAGASNGCVGSGAQVQQDFLPPLTSELFGARPAFNAILRKYPRVEALSDEIRTKLGQGETVESLLRSFSEENSLVLKKPYWEIAYYLQELLGEVSTHYIQSPTTKFSTLFHLIMRSNLERVLFLTLNYDQLLEKAISGLIRHKFHELSHYFPSGQKWMLLKIHGSVDWGFEIRNYTGKAGKASAMLDALSELDLAKEINFLGGYQDEQRCRERRWFYPALAIPLGQEKNNVCLNSQIDSSREFIRDCHAFLILGYSGLDLDLLHLLGAAEKVLCVTVVDRDRNAAMDVWKRLAGSFPTLSKPEIYPKGFSDFVSSGEAEKFLGLTA